MASRAKKRKQTHTVIIIHSEQVIIERGQPKEVIQTPASNNNRLSHEFAEQLNLYRSEFYANVEQEEAENLQRLIFAPQKKPKTVMREVYHNSDLMKKFSTSEYFAEKVYRETEEKDYETLEGVFFNIEGRWIEILPKLFQREGGVSNAENDVMLTNLDAELTVPQHPKEIDAIMGIGLSNEEAQLSLCEANKSEPNMFKTKD